MQLNVEKKEGQEQVKRPVISTQSLSLKEEEALKKRKALLEDIRDEREIVQGVSYETKDAKKIEDEIAAIDKELHFRSVKAATGNDRAEVVRELKILEEDLRKGMPSWEIFVNAKKRDGVSYLKVRNWIMKAESDPIRRKKVVRWKFLRRRLDPTDPFIADTMFLFEGTKE